MRAMILAAGRGVRMRPLSDLCPKPALPVRGLPLIAYNLALLHRHGVDEVVVNLHHLGEQVREAALRHAPPGTRLHFSEERELLDTGGGIARVADFLRGSDPSLVLAGDMLLDVPLDRLVERHRSRGDSVTLLLRRDERAATFGTIGLDGEGAVRRIAGRFDLGGETQRGVYVSVTAVAARALDTLPQRERFGHLDDWLAPLLRLGARDVRGELGLAPLVWQPVGTPEEYLEANLRPTPLSQLDADAQAALQGTRLSTDLVVGRGARLGEGVRLERAVVWEEERVPAGFRGSDGVFAHGHFHPCGPRGRREHPAAPGPSERSG